MASLQQQVSAGSEGDGQCTMVDERKRRRMISNRESAKRSRMRKQTHLEDLLSQVTQLQKENIEIEQQVHSTTERYVQVESENNVLRAQMMELSERLGSLNSIICQAEEVSGLFMDIPQIPDPFLEPWQLLCPSQPIMASANMFQF